MDKLSLNDILITPLKQIEVEGGDVFHALKNTDPGFNGFGEAYFSWIEYGGIKAWKRHMKMTMNLVVPLGKVRFIFFLDDFKLFREEIIGEDNYVRITVPPGIWFGFKGEYSTKSLILNLASRIHEAEEVERLKFNNIYFNW
jgi:dTDP-4-dehydrorhamnose 3,5-epimerase